MSVRSLTTTSKLSKSGVNLLLQVPKELVDKLDWKGGDEVVLAIDSEGLLSVRNKSTTPQDAQLSVRERIQQDIERVLPKHWKLEKLEKMSIREGYNVQVYKHNLVDKDYWDFVKELRLLSTKYGMALEIIE